MTIVGTRPEIIKLSRVISQLDKFTNHTLVHTGQNYDYELNEIFFKDLEIRKPNHFLNAVGKTTAETISKIIQESDKIIELEVLMLFFFMVILTHVYLLFQLREDKFQFFIWKQVTGV